MLTNLNNFTRVTVLLYKHVWIGNAWYKFFLATFLVIRIHFGQTASTYSISNVFDDRAVFEPHPRLYLIITLKASFIIIFISYFFSSSSLTDSSKNIYLNGMSNIFIKSYFELHWPPPPRIQIFHPQVWCMCLLDFR